MPGCSSAATRRSCGDSTSCARCDCPGPSRCSWCWARRAAASRRFCGPGLIPRLQREDRRFLVLGIMRPERDALTGARGLATAIHTARRALKLRGAPLGEVKNACLNDPDRVCELLARGCARPRPQRLAEAGQQGAAPTLVLPLDQAEELFTADAGAQAEQFLALLADLVRRLNADRGRVDRGGHHPHRPLRGDAEPSRPRRHRHGVVQRAQTDAAVAVQGSHHRPGRPQPSRPTSRCDSRPTWWSGCWPTPAEGADTLPLLSLTLARLYTDWIDAGAERLTLADYERWAACAMSSTTRSSRSSSDDPHDRQTALELLRSAFIPWLATINPDSDQPMRRVAPLRRPARRPAARLIDALVAKRLLVKDTRDGEVGGRGRVGKPAAPMGRAGRLAARRAPKPHHRRRSGTQRRPPGPPTTATRPGC